MVSVVGVEELHAVRRMSEAERASTMERIGKRGYRGSMVEGRPL